MRTGSTTVLTIRELTGNWSGCGICLDLSQPRVLQLVMEAMRRWVDAIGADGRPLGSDVWHDRAVRSLAVLWGETAADGSWSP